MADKIYIQEDGKHREATTEEALKIQEDLAEVQMRDEIMKAEREASANARASALAKLAALGLSQEEIEAL